MQAHYTLLHTVCFVRNTAAQQPPGIFNTQLKKPLILKPLNVNQHFRQLFCHCLQAVSWVTTRVPLCTDGLR